MFSFTMINNLILFGKKCNIVDEIIIYKKLDGNSDIVHNTLRIMCMFNNLN